MTGRRPLDDAELIARLGSLSRELAWPATPDLAGRVTAVLEAGTTRRRSASGRLGRLRVLVDGGGAGGMDAPGARRVVRRSFIIALIALLAIVVAATAIGLGVPGIRIELGTVATPPTSAAAPSPTAAAGSPAAATDARPSDSGLGLNLGSQVSLARARADAGFGLLVPTTAGYTDPPEVHIAGAAPLGRVTLAYPDRTLITEFLGELQPDAFEKIVGGGTTVTPVRVGTAAGWWIAGAPHELVLLYRDPDGQTHWQPVTITGNVLLWQAGDVTLRLETSLDQAAAIAIATSMR